MDFIIDTLFQAFFAFFGSSTNILEPRFRDMRYYVNQDYKITSGKCSIVHAGATGTTPSFVLEKETYYYNPRFNEIHQGQSYRLKYLPNSRYVIELEGLE